MNTKRTEDITVRGITFEVVYLLSGEPSDDYREIAIQEICVGGENLITVLSDEAYDNILEQLEELAK